jgi:hypothetical protein
MARLTQEQWQAIRSSWEYDPDEPSLSVSAARAGGKFGFKPPSKVAVHKRMESDKVNGASWERRGSMAGIVAAAQRKADRLVDSSGEKKVNVSSGEINGRSFQKEQSHREDAEDLRAEVYVRHRQEWKIVTTLRAEALLNRKINPGESFTKLKIAKITAELTQIQQAGERRAWGLDENIDVSKMTDQQLQDIINGKALK